MSNGWLHASVRLAGQRDARLTRGLAWAVAEGALAAAPYPLLYLLLREVFAGRATAALAWGAALLMGACMLLRMLAARMGMPLVFAGTYATMATARLRLANHLRQLPMGWLAGQRAGALGARLTSDLDLIEQLWAHFLGLWLAGLVMCCFLLLLLMWLDGPLALLACVGLALALGALHGARRASTRAGARLLAAQATAHSALLEYLQGMAEIRGFGHSSPARERLRRVLGEWHEATWAAEIRPAPWMAVYGWALESGQACLLLAGAWRLGRNTLDPEVLVCFLVLAWTLYRQCFDIGLAALVLRFAGQALARVDALLAVPRLPEPASPQRPGGHAIVLENVGFSFAAGLPAALAQVSCSLPERGLTAVVGPSGAGKSSLIHLIARLWDVDTGAIRIGGVDVRDMGTQALHRHVAMVFQDVVLFSGTVLDNLRVGRPQASRAQVMQAARLAQAHAFIEKLPQGYDTVLDEGGASLSGGERQRLSMARALLKDAPILLLDEVTASVDPSTEADMQRAISALARGRTVVAVAHRLHSVRHADHILVLERGRLVEQGRHGELLERGGLYARLWAAQQQEHDTDSRKECCP